MCAIMKRIKNLIRNCNYLSKHSLWDQREEDIVYLTNKILDDVRYEYDLKNQLISVPSILNSKESLDLIIKSGKSFVRTGDGECKIIMGLDQPFQSYEEDLAEGLKKILRAENKNLLVGINRNYYIPGILNNYEPFYRRHAYDYRQVYKKYMDDNEVYIDATCTAYRFENLNEKETKEQFEAWRNAFDNKRIVIVSGEGVLEKLDFDIFELAKDKKYIYGPARNAWAAREIITKQIEETVDKDQLIVFILGMAGKVMISELVEKGYTCWDVGHLAKYYDYYCKRVDGGEQLIKDFYAPD